MQKVLLIIIAIFFISTSIFATTWFPAKHKCPNCSKTNTYYEIGSYGGYIYSWSSKYQYVYWPLIDSPSVYSCPNCHYSVYMWDFDSIPVNKAEPIKNYLSTVKLKKQDYTDVPMTVRLEIAEKIYQILGRDTEFWCKFYRVCGYHYLKEKEIEKAKKSRTEALSLAKTLLNDTAFIGQKKENLFIISAMNNYIGNKDSALYYLDQASQYTYTNPKWKESNAKGLDDYLTNLIKVYITRIKEGATDEDEEE